jgi:hypothetical protein
MFRNIIYIIITLWLHSVAFAQQHYPQNYFRSPLDIPLVLSGSFGELRSNHFHSGIDIKTQGVTGKAVYAAADGYVSRIKVSPYGYGNALYITHPNGYVSVYAHLDRYNDSIAGIIKWVQYKRKSFAVDYYPAKGNIKVHKGQLIAYSGNSGSSGGPHLHFEIRKASNAHPINPFLFGISVPDHQYPRISKLAVYDYYSPVYQKRQEYPLKQSGKKVWAPGHDTIYTHESFYVGVVSIDRMDGANNKNGLYMLRFYMDSSLYFTFKADQISFDEKRYINSYIDYEAYMDKKIKFQRTLIQANNHLSNTRGAVNRGIFVLPDDKAHQIRVEALDYAGQKSSLVFYVKKNRHEQPVLENANARIFQWDHNNIYRTEHLVFSIPKGALYDNIDFSASEEENPFTPYSALYHVHKESEPLHKYCSISIKADSALTSDLQAKACIVSLTKNDDFYYEGGSYKDGFVSTKTRSFGRYLIAVDTLAPLIKNYNVYPNKNITRQANIAFKVSDDLSGIDRYDAYIDGQWVLLEYDPKKNRMFYRIDQHFPQGKHEFKIVLTDSKGNRAERKLNLIRN